MLSGQLVPSSSANFVSNQQQQYFIEGDATLQEIIYNTGKLLVPITSPPISSFSGSAAPLLYPSSLSASSTVPEVPCSYLQQESNGTGAFSGQSFSFAFPSADQQISKQSAASTATSTATTATTTTTSATSKGATTSANITTVAVASANSAAEASGRSAALERAYVHDVYENCDEPVGPIRPRVAQFLAGLDPGSIVCDVGCGNGRYLTGCNPLICTVGVDRCYRLTKIAHGKHAEVALCDNLELPFRDESFDAVLSLAVVHHFATTERRVGAIRELARILRIGGRVIISVWALEQRHRRFESQDVLIPWQPPKTRNHNYSDDDDDDEYLPPYHAYTEDSTNSSRSAGDGDSSSLSSSSPGESCYSFVRRAIQKLAGGRKHPWFLDSWNSKDTKNDSSLDYEDAKDLPIELRRLEDFEDFPDPPLSAGLKSRSLGSILNPPPRQIVRSRSSVPSLGAQILEPKPPTSVQSTSAASLSYSSGSLPQQHQHQQHPGSSSLNTASSIHNNSSSSLSAASYLSNQHSGIHSERSISVGSIASSTQSLSGRRPKLVKQKQSLCDEESSQQQLPDSPLHSIGNTSSSSYFSGSLDHPKIYSSSGKLSKIDSKIFLRKQSSLNEELMAENRLREKERVRKRIQKQMSLNEAFLCRSMLTKRLQVIREGFTTKLKTSTGNLERVTKNGFVKIMQNIKNSQFAATSSRDHHTGEHSHEHQHQQHQHNHHHHNHHYHHQQWSNSDRSNSTTSTSCTGGSGCPATATSTCSCNPNCNSNGNTDGNEDQKLRRHSRESGSDSSKDSSLQSDTSVESEDSFASVIFIPRPELNNQQQQQQQQTLQQQNSQKSNNGCSSDTTSIKNNFNCKTITNTSKIPSVPTSPMIMPCPPTPAHSPAACSASTISSSSTITNYPFEIPTNTTSSINNISTTEATQAHKSAKTDTSSKSIVNRFTFDEDHIQQQYSESNSPKAAQRQAKNISKITRQIIKDLPQIPKFRKQQSLQQPTNRVAFPIVRRLSAAPMVPKLMSLEIFNPETDDLDSDSSEPSSPDSIDSVISALKPNVNEADRAPITQPELHQQELERIQKELVQQTVPPVTACQQDTDAIDATGSSISTDVSCRQHLVDFAEKLSAQLLKELDDNSGNFNQSIEEEDGDEETTVECTNPFLDKNAEKPKSATSSPLLKKTISDSTDYTMRREELRERRLLLANLTRSSSPLSHSSTSSSSLSLKSQSSKAKSSSSFSELYDDMSSQSRRLKFLRNFTNDRSHHYPNAIADTTYLLNDDDDEDISYRSNDFDDEHDVIIEEDEDQEDDEVTHHQHQPHISVGEMKEIEARVTKSCECDENDASPHSPNELALDGQPPASADNWRHSNSTASLDSPSQSGGSTTHHRYYHVFREGELDALINHHVASLHIVSSYYERASWCVVAEKVQVWTI